MGWFCSGLGWSSQSLSSSLIFQCCVLCDLRENHVGSDAETQVGTYNTSGLQYQVSEQWVMGSKLAQRMISLQHKRKFYRPKREETSYFYCVEKRKESSLSMLNTSIRQTKRRCLQLTPPTFSKWEASFLKSASVPLKYQVKLMSSTGSCWTWQGKTTLSPTVTSKLEGAKIILVGSVESRNISYWIPILLSFDCY